jgi:hypothetical protein
MMGMKIQEEARFEQRKQKGKEGKPIGELNLIPSWARK